MLKNVASQYFHVYARKSADGGPFTGTIAGKVAKDTGASAAITGTITELEAGFYRVNPSQADTNGDALGFFFTATGMIPFGATFDTRQHSMVNLNLDAKVSSRAVPGAAMTLENNSITAPVIGVGAIESDAFKAGAIDSNAIGNNALTSAKFATGAISANAFDQEAANKAWNAPVRVLTANTNLNDVSAAEVLTQVNAAFTTQMTESYAPNKTIPTRDQAFLAIHQHLMNFQINGINYTVRNFADSATAYVGTLDDAANPTSQKRT